MARSFCLFLLAALGHIVPSGLAAPVVVDWELQRGIIPGTNKLGILVNKNKWPPPPIYANVGDTIIVNVNNLGIDEGLTLHAHGFHQLNNNQQDGPSGVTQCDIPKGKTYTYTWQAAVAGTFWVHSHKVGQYPHGLRTPLIVQDDTVDKAYYEYDKDLVMSVSDFWDVDQRQIDSYYWNGTCCYDAPDSKNCGLEIPPNRAIVNDAIDGMVEYVASGVEKAIRLRIINMSAFSSFYIFSTDPNMEFEVIEIDGVALERSSNPNLRHHTWIEIHAGQRYSVRFKPTDSFSLYSVIDPYHYSGNKCAADLLETASPENNPLDPRISVRYGTALSAKANFRVQGPIPRVTFPLEGSYCNSDGEKICFIEQTDKKYKIVNLPNWVGRGGGTGPVSPLNDDWSTSYIPKNPMPQAIYDPWNSVILHLSLTANSTGFADLNHTKFEMPTVPVLLRETINNATCDADLGRFQDPGGASGRSPSSYYGVNNVQRVAQGTTVFMVITSEVGAHPFHLHGQDFQILFYYKEGDRSSHPPVEIPDIISLSAPENRMPNPPRRDTLHISSKAAAVIAFQANNPGAWFYHCHNDFHALSGMAGVLVVRADNTTGSDFNYHSVGESLFDTCKFQTSSGNSSFDAWVRPCCTSPAAGGGEWNCPDEEGLIQR